MKPRHFCPIMLTLQAIFWEVRGDKFMAIFMMCAGAGLFCLTCLRELLITEGE